MIPSHVCLSLILVCGAVVTVQTQGFNRNQNENGHQGGRSSNQNAVPEAPADNKSSRRAQSTRITKATAYVDGWSQLSGAITGFVDFTEQSPGSKWLLIEGEINGLNPGLHGIQIDEFGNLDGSCLSAGPSFDPSITGSGGQFADTKRSAGDLDNIQAGTNNKATFKFSNDHLSLNGTDSIIGRMVVIFEQEDNNRPSTRIACGIIGIQTEVAEDITNTGTSGTASRAAIPGRLHGDPAAPAGASVVANPSYNSGTTSETVSGTSSLVTTSGFFTVLALIAASTLTK